MPVASLTADKDDSFAAGSATDQLARALGQAAPPGGIVAVLLVRRGEATLVLLDCVVDLAQPLHVRQRPAERREVPVGLRTEAPDAARLRCSGERVQLDLGGELVALRGRRRRHVADAPLADNVFRAALHIGHIVPDRFWFGQRTRIMGYTCLRRSRNPRIWFGYAESDSRPRGSEDPHPRRPSASPCASRAPPPRGVAPPARRCGAGAPSSRRAARGTSRAAAARAPGRAARRS